LKKNSLIPFTEVYAKVNVVILFTDEVSVENVSSSEIGEDAYSQIRVYAALLPIIPVGPIEPVAPVLEAVPGIP
jgi:hypothetical protein